MVCHWDSPLPLRPKIHTTSIHSVLCCRDQFPWVLFLLFLPSLTIIIYAILHGISCVIQNCWTGSVFRPHAFGRTLSYTYIHRTRHACEVRHRTKVQFCLHVLCSFKNFTEELRN